MHAGIVLVLYIRITTSLKFKSFGPVRESKTDFVEGHQVRPLTKSLFSACSYLCKKSERMGKGEFNSPKNVVLQREIFSCSLIVGWVVQLPASEWSVLFSISHLISCSRS